MNRRTATIAAVLASALTAGSLAQADTAPDFTRLIVKVGKRSVQATLGTHCVPTADGKGQCDTAAYPLKTTGSVTLSRGGEVTLLFGAPAGYVSWRAARIDGTGKEVPVATGEAKVVTKTKKRWRITLPKNLRRSTKLLGFSVNYPNAFASFEVGATVK